MFISLPCRNTQYLVPQQFVYYTWTNPLKSRELLSRGMDLRIKENNLRLKLCLLNQTDVCSKSSAILVDDQLGNDMSDWILILIGKHVKANQNLFLIR